MFVCVSVCSLKLELSPQIDVGCNSLFCSLSTNTQPPFFILNKGEGGFLFQVFAEGPIQNSLLTLRGTLRGAYTLRGPILTYFSDLVGQI